MTATLITNLNQELRNEFTCKNYLFVLLRFLIKTKDKKNLLNNYNTYNILFNDIYSEVKAAFLNTIIRTIIKIFLNRTTLSDLIIPDLYIELINTFLFENMESKTITYNSFNKLIKTFIISVIPQITEHICDRIISKNKLLNIIKTIILIMIETKIVKFMN